MKLEAVEGQTEIKINGVPVSLPAPVKEFLIDGDRAVLLLAPDSGHRNVFAYGEDGRLLWRIQSFPYALSKTGYQMLDSRDGELWAVGLSTYFALDRATGRITRTVVEK